jgi:polar amino acid transport system permease protein
MWKDIILPQAIANVLPALVNEVIALLKETALIATIGGMDLMRNSQIIAAEQFEYFIPLCVAGAYYYVLVLLIESVGKKIEKKNSHA